MSLGMGFGGKMSNSTADYAKHWIPAVSYDPLCEEQWNRRRKEQHSAEVALQMWALMPSPPCSHMEFQSVHGLQRATQIPLRPLRRGRGGGRAPPLACTHKGTKRGLTQARNEGGGRHLACACRRCKKQQAHDPASVKAGACEALHRSKSANLDKDSLQRVTPYVNFWLLVGEFPPSPGT